MRDSHQAPSGAAIAETEDAREIKAALLSAVGPGSFPRGVDPLSLARSLCEAFDHVNSWARRSMPLATEAQSPSGEGSPVLPTAPIAECVVSLASPRWLNETAEALRAALLEPLPAPSDGGDASAEDGDEGGDAPADNAREVPAAPTPRRRRDDAPAALGEEG